MWMKIVLSCYIITVQLGLAEATYTKEVIRTCLIIAFVVAVVLMIVAISKFKLHPFPSIMGVSLLLALVAGIPLTGIAGVIGAGFSGTFSSIGIVIILGAFIGKKEKSADEIATTARLSRPMKSWLPNTASSPAA